MAVNVSHDAVGHAPRHPASDGSWQYLNCPRCRLSIRPRAASLRIVHCPRCVARARTLVELFPSPLPADRLYDDEPPRAQAPGAGHRDRRVGGDL